MVAELPANIGLLTVPALYMVSRIRLMLLSAIISSEIFTLVISEGEKPVKLLYCVNASILLSFNTFSSVILYINKRLNLPT